MTLPEIYVAVVLGVLFIVLGIWFSRASDKSGTNGASGGSCPLPLEYIRLHHRLQKGEITKEEFEAAARNSVCSS